MVLELPGNNQRTLYRKEHILFKDGLYFLVNWSSIHARYKTHTFRVKKKGFLTKLSCGLMLMVVYK